MWSEMPVCVTWGVFQLNETMLWYNDWVLKRFRPFRCRPQPTCCTFTSAYHIPTWRVISITVTKTGFRRMQANLFTSGKVASGKSASGEKRTQLLFLSVSIIGDLKLLHLVYSPVKIETVALCLLWKYLRKKRSEQKIMLIKAGNVLWWCVHVFE